MQSFIHAFSNHCCLLVRSFSGNLCSGRGKEVIVALAYLCFLCVIAE